MYVVHGFAKKVEIQNCENTTRNCVLYMYGFSGFAEKWNHQNCENSTGNCGH